MATITQLIPRAMQRSAVTRWRLHWLALPTLLGVLAFALTFIVLARPYHERIDIGGTLDHAFVRNFYPGETGDNDKRFRWSKPEATLVLPGAGNQAPLTLRMHGDYPGMAVRLDVGNGTVDVSLRSGWQRVVLLPRAARWSGDVQVAIFAPTQKSDGDPRVRGVAISNVELRGQGGTAPLGQALLLGVSTLLITLLGQRATMRVWVGGVLGFAAACSSAALLARDNGALRLMFTSDTGRIALALVLGGALLLLAEHIARSPLTLQLASTRYVSYIAGAALLAFLLRFGAMSYPLNFISDLRFSIQRATMVRDGRFFELFLPNPSLTPTQWDLDGPIPRSPFYYLVTSPLMWLPGDAASLAMMAFSAGVDAIAALLVAVIARKSGASQRTALCAALLAGSIPLGVQMAMSWGIYPTLLSQCLLLFAIAVWLHQRPHLHTRRGWMLFGGALALAYISYPTALLFGGLLWLTLLALLVARRDAAAGGTLKAGIFATLLALVLFYGWHVPVLVERTLPKFLTRFGVAPPTNGAPASAAATPPDSHTWNEVLNTIWNPLYRQCGALVIGLALGGALLLVLQRTRKATGGRTVLAAWWIVYVPLALMNGYIVTFILKHIVFVLPALALLGGALLGRIAARRGGTLVAGSLLALIIWQTLTMEWVSVLTAFQQLK